MFRYVIEDAAQKFEDTSILIHSFYQKANTDFGRVKIEVRLPDSVKARDIHAFLREKGNGKITKVNDSSVTYETGLYRAGTGSELRIYFPQSALKEAVRHPSYQTKDELLKEERDEAKRYAERDERIAGAERMILIFSGIVGFMVIMAVMLSFLKKRRRAMLSFEELESFDPVLVAFLYKKAVSQTAISWPACFRFISGDWSLCRRCRLKRGFSTILRRLMTHMNLNSPEARQICQSLISS